MEPFKEHEGCTEKGGYKAHISSVYLFSCVIIKKFISDQLRPSAQNMFEQAFIRILIIQIVNSKW